MINSSKVALGLLIFIAVVKCCDINVKIKLDSVRTFYAQFTFHNATKSRMYKLDFEHKMKFLKIQDKFCALKPTVMKVWRDEKPENDEVKPFGQTQAFLEGMGNITYMIFADEKPSITERFGTICSFGDCGRG